jgi:hypothetical protein
MKGGNTGYISFYNYPGKSCYRRSSEECSIKVYGQLSTGEIVFEKIFSPEGVNIRSIQF